MATVWDDFKCLCLQLIFPLQDMPTRLQTLSDLVITPCPGLSRCWTNTFRMNEWMHSEPPVITILLSYPPLPRLLFVVWLEAINTKVSFRNTTQALISTSLYSILTHPWSHRIPSLASSHASRTFSPVFLSIIINSAFFHSQKCLCLDDKLYGDFRRQGKKERLEVYVNYLYPVISLNSTKVSCTRFGSRGIQ